MMKRRLHFVSPPEVKARRWSSLRSHRSVFTGYGTWRTLDFLGKAEFGCLLSFEILIRPEGSFDFGTATSSDPPPAPYIRRLVSENLTSYTVEGLISGQQYRVGVLTYVNVNGTIKRSDFNNVTSVCTPD